MFNLKYFLEMFGIILPHFFGFFKFDTIHKNYVALFLWATGAWHGTSRYRGEKPGVVAKGAKKRPHSAQLGNEVRPPRHGLHAGLYLISPAWCT
jgi:hypothetical protein